MNTSSNTPSDPLTPSPELDARIAVEVMEWEQTCESWFDKEGLEMTVWTSPDGKRVAYCGWGSEINWDGGPWDDSDFQPYSSDLSAAFEVAERAGIFSGGYVLWQSENGEEWHIGGFSVSEDCNEATWSAPTIPLVICAAALAQKKTPSR